MTELATHRSVMQQEVIAGLNIKPDGIYVDATFGRGGHSRAILNALGESGQLLAIDQDPDAVRVAKDRFAEEGRFSIRAGSFTQLNAWIAEKQWENRIDGILLDLGISSPQVDVAERGFSFRQDGPLDMRMDTTQGQTAADWINQASADEIKVILWRYGEERFAKRIATAIVAARQVVPILRTGQLAELICEAIPVSNRQRHPATRSFQAIRLYVNRELEALEQVLPDCLDNLAPEGRLVVISFHSLEDRIVKNFMRERSEGPVVSKHIPLLTTVSPRMKRIGKAIKPSLTEIAENPRARSAMLRIGEKIQ